MADRYGATTLPLPATPDGQPIGDPALYYFGSFFQAVTNAFCGKEWARIAPADGDGPVSGLFFENPFPQAGGSQQNPIDDNSLPAFWVWRGDFTDFIQRTSDTRVVQGLLNVLWIAAPAQPETARAQEPFWQALIKSLDRALNVGRDPSWVVPGDEYYHPERYGSSLAHWARYRRAFPKTAKRTALPAASLETGADVRPLDGYLWQIFLEESLIPDASARGVPLKGMTATITGNSQTEPTAIGPAPGFGVQTP